MLEKDIERAVCGYARERGILTYKFTSPARSAVPDRLFILPGGAVVFVEFKRKGARPTAPQEREHVRLRAQGCAVYVIDSVDDGKVMVDDVLNVRSEPPPRLFAEVGSTDGLCGNSTEVGAGGTAKKETK